MELVQFVALDRSHGLLLIHCCKHVMALCSLTGQQHGGDLGGALADERKYRLPRVKYDNDECGGLICLTHFGFFLHSVHVK